MASSGRRRSSSALRSGTDRREGAEPTPEGRFVIEAVIGSGATSTVCRAWDILRQGWVALKILNEEIPTEWEVLTSLNHNNIVKLYGSGRLSLDNIQASSPALKNYLIRRLLANEKSGGDLGKASGHSRPYIAMEFLDGQSLEEELLKITDWKMATRIIQNCALALATAHQKRVLHCDIKPSNVFVNRLTDGVLSGVTVLDFGLAAHLSSSEGVMPDGGTPAYMSPEQISGRTVNEASDIFSLGVLSFQLLTHHHPFAENPKRASREDLEHAISDRVPQYIGDINRVVPDHIALTVHRALAKDPLHRPSAMELSLLLADDERGHTVFQAKRREADQDLQTARKAYAEGRLDTASEVIATFERRGLAFPEAVQLRYQIDATQADWEVRTRTTEARELLGRGQLEEAAKVLRLAQYATDRRFDFRVLSVEAQLRWCEIERAEALDLHEAARAALDAGSLVRAKWLLEKLEDLRDASPFRLKEGTTATEDLRTEIDILGRDEREARTTGHLRTRQDTRERSSAAASPAIEALDLLHRARARRPILERALELLNEASAERQIAIALELDRLHDKYEGDTTRAIVDLVRQRRKILDDLHENLRTCEEAADFVGALQVVIILQQIDPSPALEESEARWWREYSHATERRRLEGVLRNFSHLADLGEWLLAHDLMESASCSLQPSNELSIARARVDERLTHCSQRDALLEHHLERLRQHDLPGAISQLQSAYKLDPGNKVLALALANLALATARTQEQFGEVGPAFEMRETAAALLDGVQDNPIFESIRNELRARHEPRVEPQATTPSVDRSDPGPPSLPPDMEAATPSPPDADRRKTLAVGVLASLVAAIGGFAVYMIFWADADRANALEATPPETVHLRIEPEPKSPEPTPEPVSEPAESGTPEVAPPIQPEPARAAPKAPPNPEAVRARAIQEAEQAMAQGDFASALQILAAHRSNSDVQNKITDIISTLNVKLIVYKDLDSDQADRLLKLSGPARTVLDAQTRNRLEEFAKPETPEETQP